MSEQAKPSTETTEPARTETKPDAAPATGGDDLKRLRSELDGVHKSAQQWKTDAEKYRKELDKINADRQKAAEAKALEAGEHEKVIADREKKIAELEQALKQTQHEALVSHATAKLAGLVPSEFARRAMAAEWAAKSPEERAVNGAFEAFIEAQKQADPHAFGSQAKPVTPAGGAGNIDAGGGDDLRSRLNSTDPTIKRAAAFEEARMIAEGKLQPGWDLNQ